MMKLISWNVNGLRACMNKGFMDFLERESPDFIGLQETKLQAGQIELELPGYHQYWNYADKKGYSGTAVFAKEEPLNVHYGLDIDVHDHEGRVITLEYPDFFCTTVYVPNAKEDLSRLEYRQVWEDDFLSYQRELERKKPVIWCGDLNVAHREIDLKNPRSNRASRMRSAASFRRRWTPASSILTVISIPTERAPTAGGATGSTRARTMRGGASTTS